MTRSKMIGISNTIIKRIKDDNFHFDQSDCILHLKHLAEVVLELAKRLGNEDGPIDEETNATN